MKGKTLISFCVGLVALIAIAIWFFAPAPANQISVTFVGYTNNASTIPFFGFATSNLSHRGFAVLRAENATRSTFSGYVGPLLIQRTGAAEPETIALKGALQTASTRGGAITGNDFQLSPGGEVTFAVPAPDFQGKWQCGLCLTHIYNYKYRWQYNAVVFAQRCGLHWGEGGHFAMSEEIVR